ncbi:Crp/Fnr family transcriptional regulator [Echinicola soli]|uniref:Crp/Fnr family transcriptional regulator n=1 Tax=Echinicola soli TaxID=2591634 RepID=A0A514CET9_9BACT|nr:Crp/Fnr family transcriptional regulator [Echinicola soli]QDH78342.1 Crp/Fnr family transcriptional regulator [Echinicola soli]
MSTHETKTELQNYLSNYFSLTTDQLEKLADLFQLETLGKGEFFARSGKPCEKLSFIKSGYLRIYETAENGKEVTQWISSKGEFTTDLGSLVFGKAARRHIQSISACELYTINKQAYSSLSSEIPQWPEIEKLFIAKCFMTLEDRIFGFLALTAEERYHQLFQLKKPLFNEVPLHYLASMIGMAPETLSRIRKNYNS